MNSTSVLNLLRVVPSGTAGKPRDSCESCGLFLWSEGGFNIPGLKGLFCSLICIECAIAEKTGSTKKIPGAPMGSGARLLAYLKSEAPAIYAQLLNAGVSAPNGKACLGCGVPLEGKRADAEFCSDVHRKRFGKSSTAQKAAFIAETPIGKQGLTDAQNASWTHTPETAIPALSAPRNGDLVKEMKTC